MSTVTRVESESAFRSVVLFVDPSFVSAFAFLLSAVPACVLTWSHVTRFIKLGLRRTLLPPTGLLDFSTAFQLPSEALAAVVTVGSNRCGCVNRCDVAYHHTCCVVMCGGSCAAVCGGVVLRPGLRGAVRSVKACARVVQ